MELISIEDVKKRISYKDRKKKEEIVDIYDEIIRPANDVIDIEERKYETIQEKRRRNEATSIFDDE